MASRAKKKNKGKPREPGADPKLGWQNEEEGIELTKRQERWLEMFFGAIVFFGAAGWFTIEIFGSWKVSLACGIAAAVLAVVLVRRGDTLF
jgi:hypothetical protein